MPFDQYCRNERTFCIRSPAMTLVKMGKNHGSGICVAVMHAGELYPARGVVITYLKSGLSPNAI